nr:MAG TPA: hypothetical protein [Caudoviricetes sp.]
MLNTKTLTEKKTTALTIYKAAKAAYRQVRQAPRRSAQGVRDRQSRSRTS